MIRYFAISFFLSGIIVFSGNAQHTPFDNWSAGINAGLYGIGVQGANRASTNGLIKNYRELSAALGEKPELRYKDIVVTPNDDGSFDGRLDMGNAVKPYFGIGLGRTIPRNRVGFKFELGMVYQGKYALSSSNLNEGGKNWVNEMTEELDLPVSENTLK